MTESGGVSVPASVCDVQRVARTREDLADELVVQWSRDSELLEIVHAKNAAFNRDVVIAPLKAVDIGRADDQRAVWSSCFGGLYEPSDGTAITVFDGDLHIFGQVKDSGGFGAPTAESRHND